MRSNMLLQLLKHSSHGSATANISQISAQFITGGLGHTTIAWNHIIRAYAKGPTPIRAIHIYDHLMRSSSALVPDHHTYIALLKASTRLLCPSRGREIHAHVVKLGFDSDKYTQNALIHFYATVGELGDARQLFDLMSSREVETWNIIIQGYGCHPGYRDEGIGLFREMVRRGMEVDEVTLLIVTSFCAHLELVYYPRLLHVYALKLGLAQHVKVSNGVLGLYCKARDMDHAFQLFLDTGRRDVVSQTILINGYIELGLVDVARAIFNGMTNKDVILWNSLIGGYLKVKRPREAVELFEKMEMEGVSPDQTTAAVVLSACSSLLNLQLGISIHRYIQQGNLEIDQFVGAALVDMYAKCGKLEEAVCTFNNLKCKDVFCWTTMIMGLGRHGYGKEALRLFLQMQREGVKPNEATFVAVLTACSHSGLVDEGEYWFRKMVQVYEIEPGVELCSCLIDLFSRAGWLSRAEELIRTIVLEGKKMIAYKALLSACVNYNDVCVGEKVAKELLKFNSHCHGIYVLLSNFYAFAGSWNKVEQMRGIMKELNLEKQSGASVVETKS